jgi:hypothetical protein
MAATMAVGVDISATDEGWEDTKRNMLDLLDFSQKNDDDDDGSSQGSNEKVWFSQKLAPQPCQHRSTSRKSVDSVDHHKLFGILQECRNMNRDRGHDTFVLEDWLWEDWSHCDELLAVDRATMIIDNAICEDKLYKIGITAYPVQRMCTCPYAYELSGETWQQMHLVHVACCGIGDVPVTTGYLEKTLLSSWKEHTLCMNVKGGGEGANTENPNFLYIVTGHRDRSMCGRRQASSSLNIPHMTTVMDELDDGKRPCLGFDLLR